MLDSCVGLWPNNLSMNPKKSKGYIAICSHEIKPMIESAISNMVKNSFYRGSEAWREYEAERYWREHASIFQKFMLNIYSTFELDVSDTRRTPWKGISFVDEPSFDCLVRTSEKIKENKRWTFRTNIDRGLEYHDDRIEALKNILYACETNNIQTTYELYIDISIYAIIKTWCTKK